jgi:hypothetical protein
LLPFLSPVFRTFPFLLTRAYAAGRNARGGAVPNTTAGGSPMIPNTPRSSATAGANGAKPTGRGGAQPPVAAGQKFIFQPLVPAAAVLHGILRRTTFWCERRTGSYNQDSMLTPDQISELHRLHWVEKWPLRKIARHLHTGRRTIAKYLATPAPKPARRERAHKIEFPIQSDLLQRSSE